MPRTPDRFEKSVWKRQWVAFDVNAPNKTLHCIDAEKAVDLLRDEHAWMRGMVKKEKRELAKLSEKTRRSSDPRDHAIADCLDSRIVLCDEIIDRLTQRRK